MKAKDAISKLDALKDRNGQYMVKISDSEMLMIVREHGIYKYIACGVIIFFDAYKTSCVDDEVLYLFDHDNEIARITTSAWVIA